jgi:hypothetical protein
MSLHRFVADLYAKKFAELENIIPSKLDYIRTVQTLGNETVCMHLSTYVYVLCVYACLYACRYVGMHACMYLCIYVFIYKYLRIYGNYFRQVSMHTSTQVIYLHYGMKISPPIPSFLILIPSPYPKPYSKSRK